jgi:hypothetical protein
MPQILEHQRRFFSRADAGRFAGQTENPYVARTGRDLLAGFPLRAVVLEVGCGEGGNVANLRARPGRGGGGWCVALSEDALPVGEGSGMVVALFNRGVGRLCPPMIAFLGLDAVGALLCRHPAARLFLFLAALAVLHDVVICASTTLAVQYRVPFDRPATDGERRRSRPCGPLRPSSP